MRYLNKYDKFMESKKYGYIRIQTKPFDINRNIEFEEILEGIEILNSKSLMLNEEFISLGKIGDKLGKLMSKVPGLNKLFQNKEYQKNVEVLRREVEESPKGMDIAKQVFDRVSQNSGGKFSIEAAEKLVNNPSEIQEMLEEKPLVLPAIGTPFWTSMAKTTAKQVALVTVFMGLFIGSMAAKTYTQLDHSLTFDDVKKEITVKEIEKQGDDKTIKLDGTGGDGGKAGGATITDPTNDGKINYIHSASSATKAYQSELGQGGEYDKGLPKGSDGSYNHVYEIKLSDFYKLVEKAKQGNLDMKKALADLKPSTEKPDAKNPNLFQIGDDVLKTGEGVKGEKLFSMAGKDGSTIIKLSGNGLYNFGRLIEAAKQMGTGEVADFVKISFGEDVGDEDARAAFGFTFDAGGFGSTIKANMNTCYLAMRGAAFTIYDFQDDYKEDKIGSLLPDDIQKEVVDKDGNKVKQKSVNLFKTVSVGGKGELTVEDVIKSATVKGGESNEFLKAIRGTLKFGLINKLFKSVLTDDEIKKLDFEIVNDKVIQKCIDHFKSLSKESNEVRLNAQLSPELEKEFLDEVTRVINSALDKYISYKLQGSDVPKEVINAIKEDIKNSMEKNVKISEIYKKKDLQQRYVEFKKKAPLPGQTQQETEKEWGEGEF